MTDVPLGRASGAIDLDLAGLRNAVNQARGPLQLLEGLFGNLGGSAATAAERLRGSMLRIGEALQMQQRQAAILQQELQQVVAKYGEGSVQAQKKQLALDRLNQSIDQNTRKFRELEQQLEQTGAGFTQFRSTLGAVGSQLTQTGAILTAAITAPLALVGGQALQAASQYETATNLFQANTQATADQMEAFRATAKALGADLTLPGASAGDAGEVMLELAKAGLSVDAALTEAKGTMQLAATEGLANAEAATIAAAAYNTFKEEGIAVAEVADLLAAGSSESSASVRSLSQGLEQAGAGFAKAHVPLRDLITQMGLMANAGIKGSDAGTSLKTMLQRLQAPTKDARSEMQRLGISVYDSAGRMRPMRELVSQFSTSLAGLTQEQRDNAIVTIFGADAQRAANIVLAGGVEAYDAMFTAVGRQGAAAELAAARMQGVAGAIDGFKSTVETVLIDAVEPFLDDIAGLITAGSQLVGMFGNLDPAVKAAAVAFAVALAALGPLMLAAGGLATVLATVNLPLLAAAAGVSALVAAANASGALDGMVAGLRSFLGTLQPLAPLLEEAVTPAVGGLTGALMLYALNQLPAAIAAGLAHIPVLIAQASAMWATAAATLAAVAPYAALAAAIGGVILVYRRWQSISADAAQKWLDQDRATKDAATALDRYAVASYQTRSALRGQSDALQQLQADQRADLVLRADLVRAGKGESQAFKDNTARINARRAAIVELTGALEQNLTRVEQGAPLVTAQTEATAELTRAEATHAAGLRAAAGDIDGALQLLRESAGLTEEDMQALFKELDEAATAGAKAFGDAVRGEAAFRTGLEQSRREHTDTLAELEADYNQKLAELQEQRRKATTDTQRAELDEQIADLKQSHADRRAAEETAIAAREQQAAEAYAREQAAQLAHLGQMLIQYVTAQAAMAGISGEKVAEMTSRLAAEYGVQQSLTDRSFSAMTRSLDAWVASGGENTGQYIADLGRIRDETVTLQQETDRQISLMTAQAREDFDAGKLSVDQYVEKLRTIPAAAEEAARGLLGIPTRINLSVEGVRGQQRAGGAIDDNADAGAPGGAPRTAAPPRTTGGPRASGGPVFAGGVHEVAERDAPELLHVGQRSYLLMGRQPGRVVPADGRGRGGLAALSGPALAQAVARGLGPAAPTLAAAAAGGLQRRTAGLGDVASGLRRATPAAGLGDVASGLRRAAASGLGVGPGGVGPGGAVRGLRRGTSPAGAPSITVNFQGGVVIDNEQRIRQVADAITKAAVEASVTTVDDWFASAVDGLALGGGTRG
jgi:TP901 family phage tail tape measure protein